MALSAATEDSCVAIALSLPELPEEASSKSGCGCRAEGSVIPTTSAAAPSEPTSALKPL